MWNGKSRAAYNRFCASMEMNYEKWHDGIGYDLEAIDEMDSVERELVESLMIRRDKDWMEIDTLAYLGTPRARKELQRLSKSGDDRIRLLAAKALGTEAAEDQEDAIINGLRSTELSTWSRAIDISAGCRRPKVLNALYRVTLEGEGNLALHAAAMIFYIHGIAREPFDWDYRPFHLRFHTTDKAERRKAYEELCAKTGR